MDSATNRTNMCSGLGADELMTLYRIDEGDLQRIREYGKIMAPKLGEMIEEFYIWLRQQPEYARFFSDPDKEASVRKLQHIFWRHFFEAEVDDEYIRSRRSVGEAHARIGLSLQSYFAAVNHFLVMINDTYYDESQGGPQHGATVSSVSKLVHLDTSLAVETFSALINRQLSEQSRAMMEMSTPVTALWNDILMLPVVGIIDSRRAQDVMTAMLSRIAETRSTVIILDISGVAVVDTAVANHLIKITKATSLMGCECIISGVSPAIAQTIVELGIDVGNVKTTATLQDALTQAFRQTGIVLSSQ